MRLRVPGDKSLTQRALVLAALADGESRLGGLLHGGDAASTAAALRALGARVGELPAGGGEVRVRGVGLSGLARPAAPLDLGNSGTGARLLLGVLSGSEVRATVTGDASLRSRPMARVTEPLAVMGARFVHQGEAGRLPLTVEGRRPLRAVDWPSPVASAQVKSAILLAALTGGTRVQLTEPRRSRDHTERMLASLGVPVLGHAGEGGWRVELREPVEALPPLDFHVPGDISSAAFLLALAALRGAGGSGVEVEEVGLNPTRTAFLGVLEAMGVGVRVEAAGPSGLGEPTGSVRVEAAGPLRAVELGEVDVPGLVDELPLVAVLGTRAEGVTRVTGASELRHKESDRIRAVVENLRAVGARAEELPDGFVVEGTDAPLAGHVRTRGDHRIAMAFGVLGAATGGGILVDDPGCAAVSFPGFWELLERARRGEGGT